MTEQERSIYVNAITRSAQWADDRRLKILYEFTINLIDPPAQEEDKPHE